MMKPLIYAFADEASAQMSGQVAAMLRNGLRGLEIRGVDGINVSQITAQKAREVRCLLDDNGLYTWSVGSPIGKIRLEDSFADHMEVFRHVLEAADILGAENIRIFSFYTEQQEACRNQVIDRLGALLDAARGSGIALCHENEKGIYGDTGVRCLDLFQTLPELKGVFDPANFVQCGEDTLQCWALLKEHIHYLHIKDALSDGSVVPTGKGQGNVGTIIRDYLARGGRAMTVEPHLAVFDGLKALEESGDVSVVGQRYVYASADEAFDAGCNALKAVLSEIEQST